jgi:pilus assembly protein CpaF
MATPFDMRRDGVSFGLDRALSSTRETLEAVAGERIGVEDLMDLVGRVHTRLLETVEPAVMGKLSAAALDGETRKILDELAEKENLALTARDRERIVGEVGYEVHGLGPIQPLLNDESITEVMVNGPRMIYVERGGRLTKSERIFRDNAHVLRIIEAIVSPLGRRIDEGSPMVDARLKDGSRVNVIIPPLAIKGPTITIRKFARKPYQVEDLIRFGTLTPPMAEFLEACVRARLNIMVSGGTGSGKTTTLNVLSSFIPAHDRIVTIEDAAELQLQQEHVVTLESRPPNIEGRGEVPIRALVRNALRMRPDRIIVGECRGGEALDMLQAMNTGHDGSLSTAHANTPRDALARLETMTLMAGTELPVRAIREQIASAVQLFVHQSRLQDGTRRVTHITEVHGMEGDVIVLQDIFLFNQRGLDADGKVLGALEPTGLRPKCLELLEARGMKVPASLFRGG